MQKDLERRRCDTAFAAAATTRNRLPTIAVLRNTEDLERKDEISTQLFSSPPNASVSSVCCSISCALCEPVAGLALAERLTESTPRPRARPLQARQQERQRAHVRRLFLHPHKFARVRVAVHLRGQFRFWKWIQLLQKNNRRRSVLAPLPLRDQFVPDFPGAQQHALRRPVAAIRNHRLKSRRAQIRQAWKTPPDSAACSSA